MEVESGWACRMLVAQHARVTRSGRSLLAGRSYRLARPACGVALGVRSDTPASTPATWRSTQVRGVGGAIIGTRPLTLVPAPRSAASRIVQAGTQCMGAPEERERGGKAPSNTSTSNAQRREYQGRWTQAESPRRSAIVITVRRPAWTRWMVATSWGARAPAVTPARPGRT